MGIIILFNFIKLLLNIIVKINRILYIIYCILYNIIILYIVNRIM